MGSGLPPLPLAETAPNSNEWVKVFPDHDCASQLPACADHDEGDVVLCGCGRFYKQASFLGHRYWAWTLI